MSMIITSVFPSPFLHRDLNFGFISVTDKVHCELFTYVHIRDERKRTQIWKQTRTQTKSWVRIHDFKFMVKQRLIGKARTRTLADFGHACTSISGRHPSTNTWTADTDIQINKFQKFFLKFRFRNRIPTVKLKIPGKPFLKSESRTSVTFKL